VPVHSEEGDRHASSRRPGVTARTSIGGVWWAVVPYPPISTLHPTAAQRVRGFRCRYRREVPARGHPGNGPGGAFDRAG
jgi:hypothetical protein